MILTILRPSTATLRPKLVCCIDDLLYTVYIGCKCRDDDPCASVFVKKAVKHFTNCTLRHGEARTFCIGTVAHQGQDTLLADLSKTLQVDRISEYRRIVNLEVSGMDYNSCRRIDCQGRCILDTVVCLDKFDREITEVDGPVRVLLP